LATIDVLNVDVDIPIEVVFKKRVDARMLKDEVLE
jgi:RNAse (barnase) inhibitor barstar